jgi:hypothetical protein
MLKRYDSRAAEVTYSSLWERLPKGFFVLECFQLIVGFRGFLYSKDKLER